MSLLISLFAAFGLIVGVLILICVIVVLLAFLVGVIGGYSDL